MEYNLVSESFEKQIIRRARTLWLDELTAMMELKILVNWKT